MIETTHILTSDQAVIAHLEPTNSAAATWARNALGDRQSLSSTEVAREEGVVADSDDAAAIETVRAESLICTPKYRVFVSHSWDYSDEYERMMAFSG